MGSLHRTIALLGFDGDDLDPAEITARLGAAPTVAVSKGGKWLTSATTAEIATTGRWRLDADGNDSINLDGQIIALFATLSGDLAAWRALSACYNGRVFCGLFLATGNEGVILQPSTLLQIGERGLLLDLDIYARDA
ncbi:DUF4279 domain-containing protein [Sphingomonas sp. AR_OL41]|uniref:DUF4279 domain-containing protein n=1 Tax=Sphingomonas sp. AR_OL41 TaxID=3042729 RepID=UPI0024807939|nr:DUF4279 domain-containing protein [Sphingomonas sp. AR_OL41]MDH7971955.1 DUF4279 domain-containing protein [Sphingomonas sp. AR_OL41]